jgi:hypothetical protein
MTHPATQAEPAPRCDYRVFRTIATGWMDSDVDGHMGRFSVRCNGGLLAQGEPLTAARGRFVHVYLDRGGDPPAQRCLTT